MSGLSIGKTWVGLGVLLLASAGSLTGCGREDSDGSGDGDAGAGAGASGDGGAGASGDGGAGASGDGGAGASGDGDGSGGSTGTSGGSMGGTGSQEECTAEQYEDETGCHDWTDCVPGEVVTAAPTPTSDRSCAPCAEGYTTTFNASECQPWTECSPPLSKTSATATADVCELVYPFRLADGSSGNSDISADGSIVLIDYASGGIELFNLETLIGTEAFVSSTGVKGNDFNADATMSQDGRYVAYRSRADNLVDGDVGGFIDIFHHDSVTGVTKMVSVSSGGTQANAESGGPTISPDGRYVGFWSFATNLVNGDTNGRIDSFIHDTQTGTTQRVSVTSGGVEANHNSGSPRLSTGAAVAVFDSLASNLSADDENGIRNVFSWKSGTGAVDLLSQTVDAAGNSGSSARGISQDGRWVLISSYADNLVTGDTNGIRDLFRLDRNTGTFIRVSVSTAGVQADAEAHDCDISNDGRFIVFESTASNLSAGITNGTHDVFVHDVNTGKTVRVSEWDGVEGESSSTNPKISGDGRFITFTGADNILPGSTTIYAYDLYVFRNPLY